MRIFVSYKVTGKKKVLGLMVNLDALQKSNKCDSTVNVCLIQYNLHTVNTAGNNKACVWNLRLLYSFYVLTLFNFLFIV